MCRVVAEGGDGLTTTCQWETFIGTNIGIMVTAEVTATALRPCVKKRAVYGLASIDSVLVDHEKEDCSMALPQSVWRCLGHPSQTPFHSGRSAATSG